MHRSRATSCNATVAGLVTFGLGVAATGSAHAQGLFDLYSTGIFPMDMLATDLDGDAHLDLVVTNRDGFIPDSGLTRLFNNGDGTFTTLVNMDVGTSPRDVSGADLNGDGHPDLVVCRQDQHISVLLNDGDGRSFQRSNYPVDVYSQQPRFAGLVDVDGDFDTDIVLGTSGGAYSTGATLTVFLNDGLGGMTQAATIPVSTSDADVVHGMTTGDFDDDGDVDVALGTFREEPCGIPYCYESFAREQGLTVFANEGDGLAWTESHVSFDGLGEKDAITDVETGDVDGDGDLDIVVRAGFYDESPGVFPHTNGVHTLLNDGTGAFADPVEAWSVAGELGYGLAVQDVDGDGALDFVTGLSDDFVIGINNGDASSFATARYPLPRRASRVLTSAFVDVTGDGRWDIVQGLDNIPDVVGGGLAIIENTHAFAGPTLDVTTLVRGQSTTWTIADATDGDRVYVLYARGEPAASRGISLLGGLTLDLGEDAVVIGSASADASGVARLIRTVPSNAPVISVTMQAVIRRGPGGADSVKTNFQTARIQ